MTLAELYRRERAPLFVVATDTGRMIECCERAAQAIRTARIKRAWDAAEGYETYDPERDESEPGRVRLVIRPDDAGAPDDFDGTERELAAARDRAARWGMWGVVAEYWDGAEWRDTDSVWGFIGDDWRGSGYDVDLMDSALSALAEHDSERAAEFARELEDARPDMYSQT